MKNKLYKLEAIRGLAALYVVFHHSFFSEHFIIGGRDFSFLFKFGQEAVILFFLMSGFVIGYSFVRSKDKSLINYFKKRFFRIYIPLIFVLVTHYLITSVVSGYLVDPQWKSLIGNLLMLQDVSALKPNVLINPYLGNSPLWSLSYEWWFYMAFYLFYVSLRKTSSTATFVAFLVLVSASSYIWYPFFLNRLFMYYGIWWVGVVMAESFLMHSKVRFQDIRLSTSTLLLTAGILAVNSFVHAEDISTIGVNPLLEIRHFAFAIVVIGGALIWQKFRWLFFDRLLGVFGMIAPISYVLYISHFFLVSNATYLDFIGNRYVEFFIYLAIAMFYSYLVEVKFYPWMKGLLWKTRYLDSSKVEHELRNTA